MTNEETALGRSRRTEEDDIKMDLKQNGSAWTGLIWLRIGTGYGVFLAWK